MVALLVLGVVAGIGQAAEVEKPNVVVIFTDDQGYADVGCFGAEGFATPHLDRMAEEGMRFTDFYVSQPVCSASRSSLLTGCYANRIGIHGALGPGARHGIADSETTLAEVCKSRGYATAMFGKWHLGHHPRFLPTRHGFDEYYGLPYSNDMWPFHPTGGDRYPPLPLIEREESIATNPDQTQLTRTYGARAVDFIERNAERPFFLYVAHSMPHVPLFVSEDFEGSQDRGLYGDVIAEIDHWTGEILKALERNGLTEKTLVVFTSDNGPWLSYGDHGGSTGPLREGKGTTFEGGVRVPAIFRWPGVIPAGTVCREPAMTIDILPTVAEWIGADLPEHTIDGLSIVPLLEGKPGAETPHEAFFFYYHNNELEAMRSGKWKLHFPHRYRTLAGRAGGTGGKPVPYSQGKTGLELYDLESDIGETTNVAAEHPEVMKRLLELAESCRAELGDRLTKRQGSGNREPGRLGE